MESKAADMLSALGHSGRLAIYRLLVKAGPDGVAAGEIARRLSILPNTLSSSLNVLSHSGLIVSRREGRSIFYAADFVAMGGLLGFLLDDCCGGAPQVCAPIAKALAKAELCR